MKMFVFELFKMFFTISFSKVWRVLYEPGGGIPESKYSGILHVLEMKVAEGLILCV